MTALHLNHVVGATLLHDVILAVAILALSFVPSPRRLTRPGRELA